MKWATRKNPILPVKLLCFAALILILSSISPVTAQAPITETAGISNLLVYKEFREEPYTSPLPGACTENCDQNSTDYHKPIDNPIPYAQSGLEEVTTPGMWPYTPTVKIFSHWPSGEVTPCSGMLVQALTLITAGQCVFTHQPDFCSAGDESCWVEDLEVIPAYADGQDPFGKSGYRTILTWTAWTEAENSAYDLAAVQLRYPIGASIGWLGIGFKTDDQYFLNNEFSSTSYPNAAPFHGETMAEWTGPFNQVNADQLSNSGASDSGQIGATFNGANGIAYGILSTPDVGGETLITRITYEKFMAIRDFIELGLPKETLDLAIFDVHTNPVWYLAGHPLTHFDFYLHNFSIEDLAEDTYEFNVYLSEDKIITGADILLGTVSYSGTLAAGTGLRLSYSHEAGLVIPDEIHGDQPNGGIFYIGAISTCCDSNEDNSRSNYFQPEAVWINDSDNSNYLFPIIHFY